MDANAGFKLQLISLDYAFNDSDEAFDECFNLNKRLLLEASLSLFIFCVTKVVFLY